VAHEVIEKQLVDPRGLLVGCVMADTRQGYKAVIRLDEFGRTFGGYAAHRVVGLSPDEQGRHFGGTHHALFPPPYYDQGYKILLDGKFESGTVGSIFMVGG
jgi:hypothetical protein